MNIGTAIDKLRKHFDLSKEVIIKDEIHSLGIKIDNPFTFPPEFKKEVEKIGLTDGGIMMGWPYTNEDNGNYEYIMYEDPNTEPAVIITFIPQLETIEIMDANMGEY